MKTGKDANADIRRRIKKSGLKHYEIAYVCGISDVRFCQWLHRPLTDEHRRRVIDAIDKLTGQGA